MLSDFPHSYWDQMVCCVARPTAKFPEPLETPCLANRLPVLFFLVVMSCRDDGVKNFIKGSDLFVKRHCII